MEKSFSTVLFDLDGTLLNTNNLIIESFKHTFRTKFQKEIAEIDVYKHFGEPLRTTFFKYDPERVEELLTCYREHNLCHHDQLVEAFPNAVEVVKELSQRKIKMAIVTSKMKMTAEKGLKLFGLDKYIPYCVALEDTIKHKPDPEPINKALDLLGEGKRDQILMVGDSYYDIMAAKSAGVGSVGVKWSVHPWDKAPESPDFLIEDLKDLLDIVTG